MKKQILTFIAIFTMVALTAVTFTACGDKDEDASSSNNALNGTKWSGQCDKTYTFGRMSSSVDLQLPASIEFTDNSHCTFKLGCAASLLDLTHYGNVPNVNRSCTYVISSDGATVSISDATNPSDFKMNLTISGTKMTFSYSDYGTFTMNKQ